MGEEWFDGLTNHGRHVRWALDVGLDPLASLILLCLSIVRVNSTLHSACAKLALSYQEERAIINGRRHRLTTSNRRFLCLRTCQRRDDMAAKPTWCRTKKDPGLFVGRPGSAREQTRVCPRADMGLLTGKNRSHRSHASAQASAGMTWLLEHL